MNATVPSLRLKVVLLEIYCLKYCKLILIFWQLLFYSFFILSFVLFCFCLQKNLVQHLHLVTTYWIWITWCLWLTLTRGKIIMLYLNNYGWIFMQFHNWITCQSNQMWCTLMFWSKHKVYVNANILDNGLAFHYFPLKNIQYIELTLIV